MTTPTEFERVAESVDLGTPSARKSGRDRRWPYVPVLTGCGHHADGSGQEQIRGLAFATRDEAVAAAVEHVARARRALADRLADPRHRALREQYGLPREIGDVR